MKKIAIVSQGASEGGAERVATILANYFADKRYDVFFYAVYSDKRGYYLDERVKYQYCNTKAKPGVLRMLERALRLKRYIADNKIDILISFIYIEGLFLIGSKKLKKIYSLRNDPANSDTSRIKKSLRNWIYRDADLVVFQTPDARDYFDAATKKHGIIIPNPIRSGLPDWNIKKHKKEILAAGRLVKQKNFAMLLNGFAEFAKVHPEYKLTICGDGELKPALTAQAEQLGIKNKIEFPGFVSDIHRRMSEAEIYVSTSDYEGISNSMLEALAIGIPTICTDCPAGGAKMFIHSYENGILIPVKNTEALTDAMMKAAEDIEMQIHFSNKSKEIRQRLDMQKICSEWEALI